MNTGHAPTTSLGNPVRRYRAIVWGPGRMGSFALRTMLLRPDEFEIVGCFAYSPTKIGRDVGEIAAMAPAGVKATGNRDSILATDADCVVFSAMTQLDPAKQAVLTRDVLDLLASGKNVVLAHDYFFPRGISEQFAADVEAACRQGRSTIFAGGTSPGFVCERLATTIAGQCLEVESIEVIERMDITNHHYSVYPHMGLGLDPKNFPREKIIAMFGHFYRQTPHAVAHTLGQRLQRVQVDATFAVTERELTEVTGPVPRGSIAAMALTTTGFIDDRPFVTFTSRWVVDTQIPGWEVDNDWLITVEGTPSVQLNYKRGGSFAGGIRRGGDIHEQDGARYIDYQSLTTVATLINAIPDTVAAAPGVLYPTIFGAPRHRRSGRPLDTGTWLGDGRLANSRPG
ncbi:MAG: hypothetical protein AB7Q97_09505 [Gammaproteobacteria bacterium]